MSTIRTRCYPASVGGAIDGCWFSSVPMWTTSRAALSSSRRRAAPCENAQSTLSRCHNARRIQVYILRHAPPPTFDIFSARLRRRASIRDVSETDGHHTQCVHVPVDSRRWPCRRRHRVKSCAPPLTAGVMLPTPYAAEHSIEAAHSAASVLSYHGLDATSGASCGHRAAIRPNATPDEAALPSCLRRLSYE